MRDEKIRFKAQLSKPDRYCIEQYAPAKRSGMRCHTCGCKLKTAREWNQ